MRQGKSTGIKSHEIKKKKKKASKSINCEGEKRGEEGRSVRWAPGVETLSPRTNPSQISTSAARSTAQIHTIDFAL